MFGRKHNQINWGLIAGAIELGETPAQAMVREAWEETGLIIEPEKVIGIYGGEEQRFTYSNGHQVEYLTIIFECSIKSGQLTSDNEEMKDLQFFPENELPPIANKYPDYIFTSNQKERAHFISMNLYGKKPNGIDIEWTTSTFGYLSIPVFVLGIVFYFFPDILYKCLF